MLAASISLTEFVVAAPAAPFLDSLHVGAAPVFAATWSVEEMSSNVASHEAAFGTSSAADAADGNRNAMTPATTIRRAILLVHLDRDVAGGERIARGIIVPRRRDPDRLVLRRIN